MFYSDYPLSESCNLAKGIGALPNVILSKPVYLAVDTYAPMSTFSIVNGLIHTPIV